MFSKPLVSFKQDDRPHPLWRTAELTAAAVGFVATHRWAMKTLPNFGNRLYGIFSTLEERSPNFVLRTFGLSELYSSYLPKELTLTHGDIFWGSRYSPMGEHLQRMLGTNFDLRKSITETTPLRFLRTDDGSAYMKLEGAESIQVRFFKQHQITGKAATGKIAGSSQRLGASLQTTPFDWTHPSSIVRKFRPWQSFRRRPIEWTRQLFKNIGKAQHPEAVYEEIIKAAGFTEGFQPGAVRIAGRPLRNLADTVERTGFLMGERFQTLLADIRFGLWKGTYNKLFTLPFMGGESRGLVNQLLTKRVLPIALGAVGLGYADYLTHHVVSDTAIDLYQQARVAHAKFSEITGLHAIAKAQERVVPGAQYAPLALPLLGVTAGAAYHYSKVVTGQFVDYAARAKSAQIFKEGLAKTDIFLKYFNKRSPLAIGLVAGMAALIPFIPGLLGSRKTARELQGIFGGDDPVAIRAGRWWDLGTTPWEGNRIKEYRAHWTVLHKSRAEKISLYGSEKEYWAHNPLLHPIRWIRDPYWLERQHYKDRPYPITSPAFSNVPLIGPLLAGTIGKLIKPPVRMHPEWDTTDYSIGSSRLQPKGMEALPPAEPKPEFGLKDVLKREALISSEVPGLPGFITRTLYGNAYPNPDAGKDVYFQGSRMMENISRRYYEKELGAGLGPNPELSNTLGYSEPLRRFIQPEPKRIEVNDIPNTMPSWLPGEDYFLNFRTGDPFVKIPEGYARLPGEGYEALHPEVAGLVPEDYPELTKMAILSDVAPYSVEYRRMEAAVRRQSFGDTEAQIEYEKIRARVKAMKDSVVRTDERRFSKDIEKAGGTISRVSGEGIELAEFPGRVFTMSSVGYSAADMSAAVLGEHNDWSRAQVANEVGARQQRLIDFFGNYLKPGTQVQITASAGSLTGQERIPAVFDVGGTNLNKALITEGIGQFRRDLGGAESQAMFGPLARFAGAVAEDLSFTGDEARWNPLRYIPSPYHTKLWQERTSLAQYQQQEVEGSRLRRWQHPLEDFLLPYARGAYRRVVGDLGIPDIAQKKWDLNTMADMLEYIRDMKLSVAEPGLHGRYTSQASRTAIGSNLFGEPTFIASTFSGRDATYFQRFLRESDPKERRKILSSVPKEMARALSAQWVAQQANIVRAEGVEVPEIGEGGRLYTEEGLKDYSQADTRLSYGDYMRSKEIAEFFSSKGLNLPEKASSPLYDPAIDYEDVKLKVVQQEGYDAHDFGLFDDRAALLWRKPYIDGAVRELTGPDRRSVEDIRKSVEDMIVAAHDKNPQVMITSNQANKSRGNVRVDVDVSQQEKLLQDMRRNPENYQ